MSVRYKRSVGEVERQDSILLTYSHSQHETKL